MLEACRPNFTPQQLKSFVARLNRLELEAEWELVTLFRLRGSGDALYEPTIGSSTTRPDILLSVQGGEQLACDVTTVSDDDYKGRKITANFDKEARRRLRVARLPTDKFSFQIEHSRPGRIGDTRIQIELPRDVTKAFPPSFDLFLEDVKANLSEATQRWIKAPGIRYSVSYHPRSSYSGQSWTPFAALAHADRNNPVSNALRKKGAKLRELPKLLVKGIVICDGGCAIISHQGRDATGRTWSMPQLVTSFFRSSRSVSFVLVQFTPVGSLRPPLQLQTQLHVNENAYAPLTDSLANALLMMPPAMPRMMFAPYQARSLLDQGALGPDTGWYAGSRFSVSPSNNELRISARLLRDFLAGKIDETEFRRRAGLKEGIARAFFDDKTIVASRVEADREWEDDDQLVFTFETDPSCSAFS